MKKKIIGMILLLIFSLSGCSGESGKEGIMATIEEIPYDNLQYNGDTLTLEDVEVYQEISSSGYGYYPTVIVILDKSSLSDENFYWMNENRDIDVTCYLDEGKNKIDFGRMTRIKSYYNDSKLVYIFTEFEEYKYDFIDTKIIVSIDLTQEEEYDYKKDDGTTSKLNKVNRYNCYVNASYSDIKKDVKELSELSEEEKKMYQEGLAEEYDYQLDMYNALKIN